MLIAEFALRGTHLICSFLPQHPNTIVVLGHAAAEVAKKRSIP